MIPLAAPDEAVFFKGFYDLQGYLVAVSVAAFAPAPVGGVFDADIDRSTEGVDTEALGTGDLAPFEGATGGCEVFSELGISGKLFGYFFELFIYAIDCGDRDLLSEPVDSGEMLAYYRGSVAIHFAEECVIAIPARVIVFGWIPVGSIFIGVCKHIFDICMREYLLKSLSLAIIIWHFAAITPEDCVVFAGLELPIGFDQLLRMHIALRL